MRSGVVHPGSIGPTHESWIEVLETLPIWLWRTDDQGVLRYVSDGLTRSVGVDNKTRTGLPWMSNMFNASISDEQMALYENAVRDQKPFLRFCMTKYWPPDQRTVLMSSAIPVTDGDGRFDGYRGATLNTTEAFEVAQEGVEGIYGVSPDRKELSRELARRNVELETAHQVLQDVIHSMGEGLLVTSTSDPSDPENKVLFVNQAYRDLWALKASDIGVGSRIVDLVRHLESRGDIPSDQAGAMNYQRNLPGTTMIDVPSQRRKLYLKTTERPGGGLVRVYTDVTELEDRAEALERARRAANAANEAKSNFLASMSHEIRTPMNGVVGLADLLVETDLSPEQMQFAQTIRSSAMSLTRLITDILDISKAEAGHFEVEMDDFDLTGALREILALIGPLAREKGIGLCERFDREGEVWVRGDEARLRQVILNLLGNAVKFTDTGEVCLTCTERAGGGFVLSVTDTGIGIPREKLNHIFRPFEQVSAGLERRYEGTGLGLAISDRLVRAMGGHIRVRSELGEGSSFVLDMPGLVGRPAPAKGGDVGRGNGQDLDLSGKRVLVVEDNRTNQMVIEKLLCRLGAEVVIAEDGPSGVASYATQSPDLVLMDLSMPRMNGLEATREIRALEEVESGRPRIPIVALTGNAFQADRDAAQAAGMEGFLTKPVRLATLCKTLRPLIQPDTQGEERTGASARKGAA